MSRTILLASAAVVGLAGAAFGQPAASSPGAETGALADCLHLAATALAIVTSEPAATIVEAARGNCSDKELTDAITRSGAFLGASKIVDGTIAALRRDVLATVLDVRSGAVAPRRFAHGPTAAGLSKIAEMAAFVREGSEACPDVNQWHVYQALALPLMIAPSVDENDIAAKQTYLKELRGWIGADRWCALYAANIDKAHLVIVSADPDAVPDEPREPSASIKPLNEVERLQQKWIRPDPPPDARPGGRQYCLDPDQGEWKRNCTFLFDRLSLGPSLAATQADAASVAQKSTVPAPRNSMGNSKLHVELAKVAEMLAFVREAAEVCSGVTQIYVWEAIALATVVDPPVDEEVIAMKQTYLRGIRKKIGSTRWCRLYAGEMAEADRLAHPPD
jgi:hypothetical protein